MQLEIAPDLPDIEADELKVKEIIYNLVSNALNLLRGGKIGMRAKKIGSEIEVVVGIPESVSQLKIWGNI